MSKHIVLKLACILIVGFASFYYVSHVEISQKNQLKIPRNSSPPHSIEKGVTPQVKSNFVLEKKDTNINESGDPYEILRTHPELVSQQLKENRKFDPKNPYHQLIKNGLHSK